MVWLPILVQDLCEAQCTQVAAELAAPWRPGPLLVACSALLFQAKRSLQAEAEIPVRLVVPICLHLAAVQTPYWETAVDCQPMCIVSGWVPCNERRWWLNQVMSEKDSPTHE